MSGVGWILAPPTMLGTVGIGMVWAIGKWGFRKMGVGERMVEGGEREVVASREGVRSDGQWRDVQGPRAVPCKSKFLCPSAFETLSRSSRSMSRGSRSCSFSITRC